MSHRAANSRLFSILILSLGLILPDSAFAKLRRFANPAPGIYRGSLPENSEELQWLRDVHGIRTVLDLRIDERKDGEREKTQAEALGIRYLRIGFDGFKQPGAWKVRKTLQTLTDPSLHPIYVHCKLGRDRTGLIFGMYRREYEHWSKARAYKEMQSFQFTPWLLGLSWYFWTAKDDPELGFPQPTEEELLAREVAWE